ncbi:MAG: hypothetical protein JO110_08850 [Acetobacteraceae bacterium]|nr:hypothetical protein [Acetobacteraceae bacterium]
MWVLAALAILLLLLAVALRQRPSPVADIRLNGAWGTVYIFQDKSDPLLIKVGTTSRLSKRRKGEVSRVMADGAELRQVYAVDLPFAHAVETLARLRGPGDLAQAASGQSMSRGGKETTKEWRTLDEMSGGRIRCSLYCGACNCSNRAERSCQAGLPANKSGSHEAISGAVAK